MSSRTDWRRELSVAASTRHERAISTQIASASAASRPRNAAIVSEARPYDLSMFAGEAMNAVASRARGFFSGLETHVRMLALSEPFSAKPALDYVQDLVLSTTPDEGWRRSGLLAYRHFLDNLVQEADLRRIRYFLVSWPGTELPPAAITRAA